MVEGGRVAVGVAVMRGVWLTVGVMDGVNVWLGVGLGVWVRVGVAVAGKRVGGMKVKVAVKPDPPEITLAVLLGVVDGCVVAVGGGAVALMMITSVAVAGATVVASPSGRVFCSVSNF